MASILYVVDDCPSCGTGPLGVRVCGGCHTPVVVCDECDALWHQPPPSTAPAVFPPQPDLPCPSCGVSLLEPPSHWACYDEISTAGWQTYIKDVGMPFGATDCPDSESA